MMDAEQQNQIQITRDALNMNVILLLSVHHELITYLPRSIDF